MSLLQRWVPGIKAPIVCNGPMIGAACPALAVAVSKAGGLGTPFRSCITTPAYPVTTTSNPAERRLHRVHDRHILGLLPTDQTNL